MSEEEKPIRVVDRRMFTPEGDLRPDFEPDEAPSPAAPEAPIRGASAGEAARPPAESPRGEAQAAAPGEPAGGEARGLFGLIVQVLAMPAYAALGLFPTRPPGVAGSTGPPLRT